MSDVALRAENLTKRYGRVEALKKASFSVARGRITAFLGENGAGKTTTLKILLGFLRPDSGRVEVRVGGVGARIGYVPERPVFFGWLKGKDILSLTARWYRMGEKRREWKSAEERDRKRDGDKERKRRPELERAWKWQSEREGEWISLGRRWWKRELDERVGKTCQRIAFDPRLLERKAQTYSLGNQKKFSYLQSLIISPELLIVDEPFSSLDPVSIKRVRDLFAELRDEGKTIFLSSHLIAEIEKISDDFFIIKGGRILIQENLEKFKREHVWVTTSRGGEIAKVVAEDAERKKSEPFATSALDLEKIFLSFNS